MKTPCVFYEEQIKIWYNTSLLVPGDPGSLGTLIYKVTVETSRLGQARQTHLRSYRGKFKNVYVYYTFCSGAGS
jgi:hypothetical protein